MTDPDGTIDGSHAWTVSLPSAHSPQGTPAADGVTRGQTLGAGLEGVTHVNGVTEKLEGTDRREEGRREGERERKREGIGKSAYKPENIDGSIDSRRVRVPFYYL